MNKKCPICNGCMSDGYVEVNNANRLYYYCDFCDRYFKAVPGNTLEQLNASEMVAYRVEYKRRRQVAKPTKFIPPSEERKPTL